MTYTFPTGSLSIMYTVPKLSEADRNAESLTDPRIIDDHASDTVWD